MKTVKGKTTRFLVSGLVAAAAACWISVPAAQSQQSASGLETIQVRPNVYVIFGAGGNITVHVGEDAAILVDSGTADLADEVLDAVRAISDRSIGLIINTSADADHAGGNHALASTGNRVRLLNFLRPSDGLTWGLRPDEVFD